MCIAYEVHGHRTIQKDSRLDSTVSKIIRNACKIAVATTAEKKQLVLTLRALVRGGGAGPCHQGLKAHHKNEHVANRIVVASLEENMILSPGGRRSHAQATQDSDQVLLGTMFSRHMSATVKNYGT